MRRGWLRFGVVACLAASPAWATPSGEGRLTLEPTWRLTPNDTFEASAAKAGHPFLMSSPGGPGLFATGAYAITSELEVEVSLMVGAEQLHLADLPVLTSYTYGAIAGLRVGISFFDERVRPTLFAGTGVGLVLGTGGGMTGLNEKLTNPWVFGAGLAINLAPSWDLNFDYRLFIGSRGSVTDIGSFNGGGSWFSVGVSYLFAPEASYSSKPDLPELEGSHPDSF